MERPRKYNTKQGEAVLAYFDDLGEEHATAAQLAAHFEKEGEPIGLATIYRHLERFVQSGALRKYSIDGASGFCYQRLSEEQECSQIHLKCEKCGAVLHLHCGVLESVPRHVFEEHAFQINPYKTVFYGLCANCRE